MRALDENKAKLARRIKSEGKHAVEEIYSMLWVGRFTLYKYLAEGSEGSDGNGGATHGRG